MSGKKGMKPYPKAVKMEAIRLFYEEGLTREETAEKLGVSKGRVETWRVSTEEKAKQAFKSLAVADPQSERIQRLIFVAWRWRMTC